ncbi:hybrid sensor histidine kinase/response regulator [Noviherbaspirillum aerium]|uniref:hybrid sensor histidine kinase/response regulator n=1 Tax=Noviherbaspirillum aerium TaxID=2588497 RepID=UPI00124DBBA3|nr:hybrid sensor histidine kinase/response regulator [Noviherbaspirillum aerium]
MYPDRAEEPKDSHTRSFLRNISPPLLALLALSLVLPWLLTAWFSWYHYGSVMRETENTAQRSVIALQEHAANVLETHILILHQVAALADQQPWHEIASDIRLERTLAQLVNKFPQLSAVGLVDGAGQIQMSNHGRQPGVSIAEREYFTAHKNRIVQGIFFSEPEPGRLASESGFTISIPKHDAKGQFDGIVFVSVPVRYFTEFWRQFVPSEGYLVPMVRGDGMLLTRYPAANNPAKLDVNGPFLSHIRKSSHGIYTAISQVDQVERINAYAQVKDYPLFISYSIERKVVWNKWRADMLPGLLITVFMTMALIGLWGLVARRVQLQHIALTRWQNTASVLESEIRRRERAEAALRQGQKMEALGQLAGGIAHDFNNLLSGVIGNLEMMRVHLEQGRLDAVSRSMNAAQSIAGTATAITRRLLMFSRREVPTVSRTNFNDRIIIMQPLIANAVGVRIAVRTELAEDLWDISCDPNQLDTLLLNLAINARDAMAHSGVLSLETENVELRPAEFDEHHTIAAGQYAVLRVIDTGTGMSPETLSRAFDPFFTTKPAGQGTGLGLPMVYAFVKESLGDIRIDSTQGVGTTVTIFLPRCPLADKQLPDLKKALPRDQP